MYRTDEVHAKEFLIEFMLWHALRVPAVYAAACKVMAPDYFKHQREVYSEAWKLMRIAHAKFGDPMHAATWRGWPAPAAIQEDWDTLKNWLLNVENAEAAEAALEVIEEIVA